jgi:anti-sigma-K factor RskA
MNYETQLKIQAYLDGELSEREAQDIATLIAREQDASNLATELKNTRQAVAGFENGIKLPESREFYWSKIEKALEVSATPASRTKKADWASSLWRRLLIPVGTVAALAIAALLTLSPHSGNPEMESAMSDPGAFTYRDFSTGTTLVWLSYPAENELAQSETASTLP